MTPTEAPPGPRRAAPAARVARAHELAARIAGGDHDALDAFYRLWFDRCLALARSFTRRDESFCLDIVHDAMLRVVRSIRAMSSDAQLERWMTRVVCSAAIDRLRREARRARRDRARAHGDAARDMGNDLADDVAWLRARIEEMPGDDRALLLQRFARGHTLRAIAESTGTTEAAVHGRIRRLLERLRKERDQ